MGSNGQVEGVRGTIRRRWPEAEKARIVQESLEPGAWVCDVACLSGRGHGTLVAGIMAAARQESPESGVPSGSAIHGVAFDAKVISVGVGPRDLEEVIDEIVAEYPEDPTPEQIEELQARVLDAEATIERELERDTAIAFARLNGRVTAVNCSFGLPGNVEDFGAQELRERFPNVIEAMAQADTAAGERTVCVWAAGNAHGALEPAGTARTALPVWPCGSRRRARWRCRRGATRD